MTKTSKNFTIDVEIYEKARMKGINMSEAAERGIAEASGQKSKIKTTQTNVEKVLSMMSEISTKWILNHTNDVIYCQGKAWDIAKVRLSELETREFIEKVKEGKA